MVVCSFVGVKIKRIRIFNSFPHQELLEPPRPLPKVIKHYHRLHLSFSHLVQKEIESNPNIFIICIFCILKWGNNTILSIRSPLASSYNSKVSHPLRLQKIKLPHQSRLIALSRSTHVDSVPEIGSEEMVWLSIMHQLCLRHGDWAREAKPEEK